MRTEPITASNVDFAGSGAVISACGRYRYRLDRHVGAGDRVAAFFGVNPSIASATVDDATVRKWIGFSKRLGFKRFIVGNVFAYRATDVRFLASDGADAIGPEWFDHTDQIIAEADVIIPCWGRRTKVPSAMRGQFENLTSLITGSGKPSMCWGLTAGGDPKHPLMLGYDTPLQDW